jgi:hypothetical protein
MDLPLIVGVPVEDRDELRQLAESLNMETAITEQQYFDGQNFADLLVNLTYSAAAWATLRTWISTRANRYKTTRITYKGVEIEGVSPSDAERIIKLIDESRKGNGTK